MFPPADKRLRIRGCTVFAIPTSLLLLANLAAAGGAGAAGQSQELAIAPSAGIADDDILPNIHFGDRVRRGKYLQARLPYQPHIDVAEHRHWGPATQSLKKNEEKIYADLPRFIHDRSCPFPVVGSAVDMHEEFWAFGESIKVSKVDLPLNGRSLGSEQLGRVTTSFWNWGSHWMRTEREWRDPSGEAVVASSSGGSQSWYHNTVVVKDCEGEKLAYIKYKKGANVANTFARITVHDLSGNEVAVAYTPSEGPTGGADESDWRHRKMVVHDRNSGLRMARLDALDGGQDWRITFLQGSEVLGGLGSDPRVLVMLVAWHDAASQFGLATVPPWAFVVAIFVLIVFCILCCLPNLYRLYGYKQLPNDSGRPIPEVGAGEGGGDYFGGGRKQKVDAVQPDDVPPQTSRFEFGGWLSRGGDMQQGGDASTLPQAVRRPADGSADERAGSATGADATHDTWDHGFLRNWNPFGAKEKEPGQWA